MVEILYETIYLWQFNVSFKTITTSGTIGNFFTIKHVYIYHIKLFLLLPSYP